MESRMTTHRKRAGGDSSIELDDKQAEIDDEGGIDGETDFGAVAEFILDLETLLIIRPKELINEMVLSGVELLHLSRISLGVIDGHLLTRDIIATMTAKSHWVCVLERRISRRNRRFLALINRRQAIAFLFARRGRCVSGTTRLVLGNGLYRVGHFGGIDCNAVDFIHKISSYIQNITHAKRLCIPLSDHQSQATKTTTMDLPGGGGFA